MFRSIFSELNSGIFISLKYNFQFQLFIGANVDVYGKLRVCVRGFSEGKSEASKRATNIGLAKISNFLYTVL